MVERRGMPSERRAHSEHSEGVCIRSSWNSQTSKENPITPRIDLTIEQFLDSYDWRYIFDEYGPPDPPVHGYEVSLAPVERTDVEKIHYLIEGENDGPDWVGVFSLKDGRFLVDRGGCDYTGWGCQDGGSMQATHTLDDAVRYALTEGERNRLGIEPTDQGFIFYYD